MIALWADAKATVPEPALHDEPAANSSTSAMPRSYDGFDQVMQACATRKGSVFDGTFRIENQIENPSQAIVEQQEAQFLLALASMTDLCMDGRPGHVGRVAELSGRLALASGMGDCDALLLARAARLLNIGFLAVPQAVLAKRGPLTDCERAEIERHSQAGAALLSRFRSEMARIGQCIAANHHEWWDGTGYPNGLVGHSIPLAARIVAIADVYEALINPRLWGRDALSADQALALLEDRSGTQFDPCLVRSFVEMMRNDD